MTFSKFYISDSKHTLEGIMSTYCALERILNFIQKSENKDSIKLNWFELDEYGEEDDLIVSIASLEGLEADDERTSGNYPEYEYEILKSLCSVV